MIMPLGCAYGATQGHFVPWNLCGTSVRVIQWPESLPESPSGPVPTAWHEVHVHLQRQPRIGVSEVLGKSLDALSGVQEHGGVEVPERVHAVLPGGGVLAVLALGMTPALASAGFQWSSLSNVRQTCPPLGPVKMSRRVTGWPLARIHGSLIFTGGNRSGLSPALPGRIHDLTAARTHRIIRICERQGVPILADLAYQGGGLWLTTGIKRKPLQELTPTEKTDPQPGIGRCTSASRARRRPLEVLAHLPQVPMQPESNDVNRQGHPHAGAATLKKLADKHVLLPQAGRLARLCPSLQTGWN